MIHKIKIHLNMNKVRGKDTQNTYGKKKKNVYIQNAGLIVSRQTDKLIHLQSEHTQLLRVINFLLNMIS